MVPSLKQGMLFKPPVNVTWTIQLHKRVPEAINLLRERDSVHKMEVQIHDHTAQFTWASGKDGTSWWVQVTEQLQT